MAKSTAVLQQIPAIEDDGLPGRLKAAREGARYTRAQVFQQTSIPVKSVEKFETGDQEPSVSRLVALAQLYQTTVDQLLGLETDELTDPKNASRQLGTAPLPALVETDPIEELLSDLDELRGEDFKGSPRRAAEEVNDLRHELHALEANELIALAESRDLYGPSLPNAKALDTVFADSFDQGQEQSTAIEERIIDTALLGVDLFGVDLKSLSALAGRLEDQFNLVSPAFMSWGKHEVLVPILRPALRSLALTGSGEDFTDLRTYPHRQNIDG